MLSFTSHVSIEVSCPACSETYTVPLEVIEESQHLLDSNGPCSGMASYELVRAIEAPRAASTTATVELSRWEDDGGAP